jgi:ATP-dependent exoDNAse (exonuclease V) beta subunit
MNNDKLPPKYTHRDLLEAAKDTIHRNTSVEWSYFLKFVEETPHLRPYRTEWCVYNEDLKLSGSIDMIYENPDGSLSIYDWKRSKEISPVNKFNKYAITNCIAHLPDSNFWHYALQLNTYKALIEAKYGMKVKELFLVRLHPNAEDKTYDLIKLPIMRSEIADLFAIRLL